MSQKGMPQYRLRQFENMVTEELKPLQSLADAVEERAKIQAERVVAKRTGLDKLQARIEKLDAELADLNSQRERVMGGTRFRDRESNLYAYCADSPFAKEVDAELSMMNGVIGAFRELRRSAMKKILLVDAPEEVVSILESIAKEVKKLMPQMLKKQKELPAPRPDA